MKSSEMRALIGKQITWLQNGYSPRSGEVAEVRGRNVRIDDHGSHDWHWIPYMHQVQEVTTPSPKQEAIKGQEGASDE